MGKNRTARIRNILLVILVLNWGVALCKIVLGFITRSASIQADGFHSFSDGASNIVGLVGIYLAAPSRDREHPYGHKKYETFASNIIAILLFLVSFNIIKEAVLRFRAPVLPDITALSFIIIASTMVVNILSMAYEYRHGKKLNSDVLISDAMHTKADIFTSLSVLVALVAVRLGFPVLDIIVAVLIALFIAHAGYDIFKKTSNVLCDAASLDTSEVARVVMDVTGVRKCHKIRTRGREDDIHIDLHVQVDPAMSVGKAHDISYKIEEEIKRGIKGVTDVVVHMEPLQEGVERGRRG